MSETDEKNSAAPDIPGSGNVDQKKYFSLRGKCDQLQKTNERLVNRIHHVKRIIKKYKKERRFLMSKLDEYGDNYREASVPVMWDESQIFHLLGPPPPSVPGSGPVQRMSPAGPGLLSVDTGFPSATQPGIMGFGSPGLEMSQFGSPSSVTSKSKKSRDKEKDPSAPKKPANAFFMFCQQQRSAVQEEYQKEHNEEMSHQELTKQLAVLWKSLPQEKKKVYYDMYEQGKVKYEQELRQHTLASSMINKEAKPSPSAAEISAAVSSLTPKTEPLS